MPRFVPRNEPIRKQEILEKREDELRHQLKHDSSQEKLSRAAEKVREAHLNYIKAQKHLSQPYRVEDDTPEKEAHRKNLDEQAVLWKQYTIEEIVGAYISKS